MADHLCASGDSCPYKKMYEGSQKSLTDMSSRQSNSLTRLGRFRSGIVSVIRRAFPAEARMAESSMGKRLIDLDDEILLNFVENLTVDAARRDEKLALRAIGSILVNYGFPIDTSKPPVEWLTSITEFLQDKKFDPPSLSELFELSDTPKDSATNTSESEATPPESLNNAEPDAHEGNDLSTILWDGPAGNPAVSDSWSPSPLVPKAKFEGVSVDNNANPSSTDTLGDSLDSPSAVSHRPQLFPSTPSKGRRGRKPRVSAEPPSPFGPAASEDLDDETTQALLAASAIPRPVFTRDLVSITGSPSVVDAWEDMCRSNPSKYSVRFIAPKQRHKLRGSLVIPDASARVSTKPSDWWFKCVDSYRSAKLYELAVLLNSVGDEIVSFSFNNYCASLRLNSSRGLVGVVVVMDNRVDPADESATVLASELDSMLSERLTLIAVLTYSGEDKDLDDLCETVVSLSVSNKWSVSVPVIASKCWEYAEDRGSNSRIILGG